MARYEPIKGEISASRVAIDVSKGPATPSPPPAKKPERLARSDVFRGLTVAIMILVDDAGGIFPRINHSPWNGVTIADFVMPFFLFIVGVALTLAYKRVSNRAAATKKAMLRALKLLVLGVVLQGGYFHGVHNLTYGVDILSIRLMGVLQVKCGVRGDTSPACNAVGMIDRKIMGIQHLYKRPVYARTEQCSINSPSNGPLPADAPSWCQASFDPEGLLSTVMAIVSCLIGLQFGHVIVHFQDHKERIVQWTLPSFSLMALAFSLDFFGMHINKALYTLSYTCLTTGAAGLLFAGIYLLVDVYGIRRPTYVFEWMGMHALMIYILIACNVLPVLIQGFYWREPQNNLLRLIGV
ncbi:uncharacterized protein A4U43_C10F6390 [Asparagus officinalis]|uniref:Heparan-alpha-glucosaminide N-acetyltransferase catalytic domain-containing protein n=1 Tax=Asparagus officinalis TaxID=4686 RepID=A0A5P1E2W7_ASPOF|nr:uncharacterized protein A4U43_C10F6390 [Asparagus officinalis]